MIDFSYFLQSKKKRAEYLIDLARMDVFLGPIVDDLYVLGFDLEFPLIGSCGTYRPKRVEMPSMDFKHDFVQAINRGFLRPRFSFNRFLDRDICAHLWLHELVHFYQDMHGLFLEPLNVKGERALVPYENSFVKALIFCEAMAEVETIRASWRLKEVGYAAPWDGGLKSEWRDLLLIYEDAFKHKGDDFAAVEIYEEWHNMPQYNFYEELGRSDYKSEIEPYKGEEISVSLQQFTSLLPDDLKLPYVLEREAMPQDFRHGSVAYLWRGFIE